MIDLTTLASVKSYLNIDVTNTNSDTELQRLITSVSGMIRNWVNRDLTTATYTDKLNGTNSTVIMLPNYPVTSIASITIGGLVMPVSDYIYDDTQITLLNGRYAPNGRMNVIVNYTAGFTTVPSEVDQVCVEMVSKKFKHRDRIGVSSKGLAGETTSYDLKDMREETLTMLAAYTKVVPI